MIDTVVKYLQENNVRCKKVEDDREDYGDFIAIFGYGDLTREDIVKQIADNNLSCIFFECSIREDEYNGGRKKNGGDSMGDLISRKAVTTEIHNYFKGLI